MRVRNKQLVGRDARVGRRSSVEWRRGLGSQSLETERCCLVVRRAVNMHNLAHSQTWKHSFTRPNDSSGSHSQPVRGDGRSHESRYQCIGQGCWLCCHHSAVIVPPHPSAFLHPYTPRCRSDQDTPDPIRARLGSLSYIGHANRLQHSGTVLKEAPQ